MACSLKCLSIIKSINWTGNKNPAYKGGFAIYKNGKKRINPYSAIYERGNRIKKAVHRLVVEKALGRPLNKKEQVHHINCDSLDNRNDNLLVCSVSYHRWLHEEMARKYAQEHFRVSS